MKNIYIQILDYQSGKSPLALATVTSTSGSTPQKPGSSALFSMNGIVTGTIGGGIVEGKVQKLAVEALKSKESGLFLFNLANDISNKEDAICGGQISVLIDANLNNSVSVFGQIKKSLEERIPGVLITMVTMYNEKSVLINRYWMSSTNSPEIPQPFLEKITPVVIELVNSKNPSDYRQLEISIPGEEPASVFYLEPVFPLPKLIIAGAGHIGKALSHLGSRLDFDVTVIDDRKEFANAENIPDARTIIVGDIGRAVQNIKKGDDTYIVIVTRGHKDDAEALRPCIGTDLRGRRGMNLAVVWLRAPKLGFEQLCRGLRADLGVDGLVVLVARKPPTAFAAADKIVAFELELDANGYMPLVRAVEELTPDYRVRVLDDPMLDLDFVHLRFATKPGDRHVVEINGQDFGGFRKSDLKFLRMLLLAAARKHGKDDGWLDKSRLRDGSDKDPALNDLRADLGKYDLYGLGEEERKALLRVQRGTGLIRLGVPPENIELDASLADLTFVATTTTTKKDGTKTKPTKKQEEGLQNAATLLRDCRRLGAPGEVEDAKTPAATSRRGRSAP